MRRLIPWCASLCASAAILCAVPAGAQDDAARADVLFEQSAAAYSDGRFETAASMLEEAYRLVPEPILLYNLARARESNGEPRRALSAYRRYLEAEPEAENRGQIESRIGILERQLGEEQAPPSDTVVDVETTPPDEAMAESAEPADAEDESGRPTWLPWTVLGVGVATAGVGLALGAVAQSQSDDVENAANHEAGVALAQDAEASARNANVLLGVGGGLVLIGAVWGVIWALSGGEPDEDGAVRFGSDGLRVRF